MARRLVAPLIVSWLACCGDQESRPTDPADRLAGLEAEARALLAEHSRLERRNLDGAWSPQLSDRLKEIDIRLAELGHQILPFIKAEVPSEEREIVEELVTYEESWPLPDLWEAFTDLQRETRELRAKPDPRPAGACTPSAQFHELSWLSDRQQGVRNGLKAAYGVEIAHPRWFPPSTPAR